MFYAIRETFVKTSHLRSVVLTRPNLYTNIHGALLRHRSDDLCLEYSVNGERGEGIVRSLVNHVKLLIPLPSFCGLQSDCHLVGAPQSARLTELIKYLWNCLLLNSRVFLDHSTEPSLCLLIPYCWSFLTPLWPKQRSAVRKVSQARNCYNFTHKELIHPLLSMLDKSSAQYLSLSVGIVTRTTDKGCSKVYRVRPASCIMSPVSFQGNPGLVLPFISCE